MSKLYLICIEPLETRYTGHWHKYLPYQIEKNTKYIVEQIDGETLSDTVSPGAFLNFSSTIAYKNSQVTEIARRFQRGDIQDGDVFLVTDAWNASAMQIRYMADLLDIDIKMAGIWHAGQYDPADFLGRKIKNKEWAKKIEEAMHLLYDVNFFATEFHHELFHASRSVSEDTSEIVGFPMEYYADLDVLDPNRKEKENIVVFPHRKSEEKHPEIFEELSNHLPEYEFIIASDVCSNKDEYHDLMNRSKMVFSANDQETLGIGTAEGVLAGAIPLVPDRLSYKEMYYSDFKYDSNASIEEIVDTMKRLLYTYDTYSELLHSQRQFLKRKFFSGNEMYAVIDNLRS